MDGLPLSYFAYDLSNFWIGILESIWTFEFLVSISKLCVLDARFIKIKNIQINENFHLFSKASNLWNEFFQCNFDRSNIGFINNLYYVSTWLDWCYPINWLRLWSFNIWDLLLISWRFQIKYRWTILINFIYYCNILSFSCYDEFGCCCDDWHL